jgi:hypothetical protein
MTTIEKLRAKQNSRLIAIRAAEANAKLFYLQANGRRQKTSFTHFIQSQGSATLIRRSLVCFITTSTPTLGPQSKETSH